MLQDTLEVYQKYRVYLSILDNGRHPLFYIDENTLNYEAFFDAYQWGVYLHHEIKPVWRKYKTRRNQIIKKFERGKYMILLRSYFCYDLVNLIIEFIL